MNKWKPLDLSRAFDRPAAGQLVALRMVPICPNATYHKNDMYDIGRFAADPSTGRKLWWHGTRGVQDPIKIRKYYAIWWCVVTDFDE